MTSINTKKYEGKLRNVVYKQEKNTKPLRLEITRKTRRKISYIVYASVLFVVIIFLFFKIREQLHVLKGIQSLFSQHSQQAQVVIPVSGSFEVEDLKKLLQEKHFSVESIHAENESSLIIVELKEGPTILFSKNKDMESQISSLESILLRLTLDNKNPRKVEFRYEKPIVNF